MPDIDHIMPDYMLGCSCCSDPRWTLNQSVFTLTINRGVYVAPDPNAGKEYWIIITFNEDENELIFHEEKFQTIEEAYSAGVAIWDGYQSTYEGGNNLISGGNALGDYLENSSFWLYGYDETSDPVTQYDFVFGRTRLLITGDAGFTKVSFDVGYEFVNDGENPTYEYEFTRRTMPLERIMFPQNAPVATLATPALDFPPYSFGNPNTGSNQGYYLVFIGNLSGIVGVTPPNVPNFDFSRELFSYNTPLI